jgi:hypothetical protein
LAWAQHQARTVTLDDEDIEAIAERVAQKLRPRQAGLVTVKQLAMELGVKPPWVYEHKLELGGRPLGPVGKGRKPRWRFDLAQAMRAAQDLGLMPRDPTPAAPRSRGRPRKDALPAGVELLRGRRP